MLKEGEALLDLRKMIVDNGVPVIDLFRGGVRVELYNSDPPTVYNPDYAYSGITQSYWDKMVQRWTNSRMIRTSSGVEINPPTVPGFPSRASVYDNIESGQYTPDYVADTSETSWTHANFIWHLWCDAVGLTSTQETQMRAWLQGINAMWSKWTWVPTEASTLDLWRRHNQVVGFTTMYLHPTSRFVDGQYEPVTPFPSRTVDGVIWRFLPCLVVDTVTALKDYHDSSSISFVPSTTAVEDKMMQLLGGDWGTYVTFGSGNNGAFAGTHRHEINDLEPAADGGPNETDGTGLDIQTLARQNHGIPIDPIMVSEDGWLSHANLAGFPRDIHFRMDFEFPHVFHFTVLGEALADGISSFAEMTGAENLESAEEYRGAGRLAVSLFSTVQNSPSNWVMLLPDVQKSGASESEVMDEIRDEKLETGETIGASVKRIASLPSKRVFGRPIAEDPSGSAVTLRVTTISGVHHMDYLVGGAETTRADAVGSIGAGSPFATDLTGFTAGAGNAFNVSGTNKVVPDAQSFVDDIVSELSEMKPLITGLNDLRAFDPSNPGMSWLKVYPEGREDPTGQSVLQLLLPSVSLEATDVEVFS